MNICNQNWVSITLEKKGRVDEDFTEPQMSFGGARTKVVKLSQSKLVSPADVFVQVSSDEQDFVVVTMGREAAPRSTGTSSNVIVGVQHQEQMVKTTAFSTHALQRKLGRKCREVVAIRRNIRNHELCAFHNMLPATVVFSYGDVVESFLKVHTALRNSLSRVLFELRVECFTLQDGAVVSALGAYLRKVPSRGAFEKY